jgi:2-oxoglutarate dehydrogenase E2 component (dihydrolipoamide succinyltransferase)
VVASEREPTWETSIEEDPMIGTGCGLLIVLAGALSAFQEEPPAPAEAPAPAPAPAEAPPAEAAPGAATLQPPVPVPALAPAPIDSTILVPGSLSGFRRLNQPDFGPLRPPSPAQDVAMLEAGRPLFPAAPAVKAAAVLLTQLTAMYVEDAGQISALAIRTVQDLRAAGQAVAPFELLQGATQWKRPAAPSPAPATAPGSAPACSARGFVPREFLRFIQRYRTLRIDQGKDHATALSLMAQ